MATFKLSFKMDNDAFKYPHGDYEAARILRDVADRVQDGFVASTIRDSNGAIVGSYELTE